MTDKPQPLTPAEAQELTYRIRTIREAMMSCAITVGDELHRINESRLYREFGTWTDFITGTPDEREAWERGEGEPRFAFTASRSYQLIDAYRVHAALEAQGVTDLPRTEAQCRPLRHLIDKPKRMASVWKKSGGNTTKMKKILSTGVEMTLPREGKVDLLGREKIAATATLLESLIHDAEPDWLPEITACQKALIEMIDRIERKGNKCETESNVVTHETECVSFPMTLSTSP